MRANGSRREVLAALAVGSALCGWLALPALLRHADGEIALWRVAVELQPREAGRAWRSDPPPGLRMRRRLVALEEDGVALEAAPPAVVRSRPGTFAVTEDRILLQPTSGDPTEHRYVLRAPRDIPAALRRAVAWTFVGLHALAAALVLPSLGGRLRVRKPSAPVLLAGVGLFATLCAIGAPDPTVDDRLAEKLADFDARADEWTTVFVGSSKVLRQLDPRVFDEALEGAARPSLSYNLGETGTRMNEGLWMVRRILRRSPAKLRWIVLDCMPEPLREAEENLRSERSIRWHDVPGTILALRGVAMSARRDRLRQGAAHVGVGLLRWSGLGEGVRAIRAARRPEPRWVPVGNRGFWPLDLGLLHPRDEENRQDLATRRELLERRSGWFRRQAERLAEEPTAAARQDPFEIELWRRAERLAAAQGVSILHVVGPDIRPNQNLLWAAEHGIVRHLVRFDDPGRYPELFDVDNRFDLYHLDAATSATYTRELAERFLRLAEASGDVRRTTDDTRR